VTGPLCLVAAAQTGYIDLEAEAAAREAAGSSAPEDPYGVAPAPAYPATGFEPAPPTAAGSAAAASANRTGAPGSGAPGSGAPGGLGSLVLQVQQLQQEVMQLNGRIEEQAHELRQLREQSLQRYMDLDKRLSEAAQGEGAAAGATAGVRGGSNAGDGSAAAAPRGGTSATGPGASARPEEKAAYDAAYAMVVGRRFEQALTAFQQFLRDFPDGRYTPNAHYWLGELYLVIEPPDLEASRQSFALLISEYPEHAKAADALYKLGKVQFQQGNRDRAREYLDLVVRQYASSDPAVVKLARDFIAENY